MGRCDNLQLTWSNKINKPFFMMPNKLSTKRDLLYYNIIHSFKNECPDTTPIK